MFLVLAPLIALTPGALGQFNRNAALIDVRVEGYHLKAGMENQLNITLTNVGEEDANDVKLFLTVPPTVPGMAVVNGSYITFENLESEKNVTAHPSIMISKSCPPGTYPLELRVEYFDWMLGTRSDIIQVGLVVDSSLVEEPILDVELRDPYLKAGAKNEREIVLENVGGEPVFDVDVTVASTSPYIVVVEEPRLILDGLGPKENATFTPTILVSRSAPIGVYTLTANISYEDSEGSTYLKTLAFGVSVDSVEVAKQTTVVLKRYTTDPETIHPGYVFDLELELACLGAVAHDLKVSLTFDPSSRLHPLTPTMSTLGDLEPGEVARASYRIIADGDIRAGQYPATVAVSYLDVDGAPKSLVETITFSVRGIFRFSLINEEPITAAGGRITEFEADLLLTGTESVRFVSIGVVEDENFRRTAGSEEYIGAVDPDNPLPFDLKFKVADTTTPGEYEMTLRLTYTDDLNREHESTIDLPVTVTEAPDEAELSRRSPWGFWIWLRRLFGLLP
ncbi:MAG: COG1361 S-layer family protein [Candidatus Bathyarchaeia archaeon]